VGNGDDCKYCNPEENAWHGVGTEDVQLGLRETMKRRRQQCA
jgi:hypothetical protein